MKVLLFTICFLYSFFTAFSTTWDEPWKDEVIKKADYFVLAKILSSSPDKGISISITNQLGGIKLPKEITISNFYLLDLCSTSGGDGPQFEMGDIKESYFFIKKNSKGEYCIATPTEGFDQVLEKKVIATYRHSYHQAMVDQDVYEPTMTAIFQHYHDLPYDAVYIEFFTTRYISTKPAGFGEDEIDTFFNQHVALEVVYHLGLTINHDWILPFLNDTTNFHNQVSGARALFSISNSIVDEALMSVIKDSTRDLFVQVICINALKNHKPTGLKKNLENTLKGASEEFIGFGGNVMDPRVCTSLPSVKEALDDLITSLDTKK